jgi:hypothetical protein
LKKMEKIFWQKRERRRIFKLLFIFYTFPTTSHLSFKLLKTWIAYRFDSRIVFPNWSKDIYKSSMLNIWVECSLGYHNLGGLKTHKVHQN